MPYALASEYDRLTELEKSIVTHIIPDDGTWDQAMITSYVNAFIGYPIDTKEQEEIGR